MITDSITNASATAAPSSMGKKKRNNKSAKMKQNKLGLRREQWLSQVAVTNKVSKEERSVKPDLRDNNPVENLNGIRREDENHHHNESFMQSPSNSSIGGTDLSTNFSGRSSRSSSSSSGFCSGNISEEENLDDDDDDGCVDDWEAVADALAAEEENEKENRLRESVKEEESVGGSATNVCDSVSSDVVGVDDVKQDCCLRKSTRAWRPDDDLRPQGLPNLGKQLSFPELDKRFSSVAIPSSCPICYEDLDLTDSNFLPCPCGFRICLFCHKTICDGDGRCPGCRKPYDRNAFKAETSLQGGGLTIRLARSSSMFCRF